MIGHEKEQKRELLSRGVEEIIENDKLEAKLNNGKRLRIKLGIDPLAEHTLGQINSFIEVA